MSVSILLQARMASTRLPGKVLLPVLGKPLLQYQIERLLRVRLASQLIVVTTVHFEDDEIEALCCELGVTYFRGNAQHVLSRYYEAAQRYQLSTVVRVTGDCPLIDPDVVDDVIQAFLNQSCDYVSNTLERTYPRGLDVEVFHCDALRQAFQNALSPEEQEHVTPYFYNNPQRFRLGTVKQDVDRSDYRWTVDTPEDYQLIELLLRHILPVNPLFTQQDLIQLMIDHPEWRMINASVQQVF